MTEKSTELNFDRAAYAEDAAPGQRCTHCKGPLVDQYFTWQQRIVCANCHAPFCGVLAESRSREVFVRAALRGAAAAFGCGVLYAIFVQVTHMQIAIATIGIAMVVAKVLRRASGGISGRRFQVLAVALTYMAACMGYAPGLIQGVQRGLSHRAATHVSADGAANGSPPAAAGEAPPLDPEPEIGGPKIGRLVLICIGILFAAPFMEFSTAPLGLLIVGFGLWQAWKLSRGLPLTLDGPYRVAPENDPSPTV